MPRPKDDADKLKRNRESRRELIDGLGEASDSDFDELSEVTQPDIKIDVHVPAVQRGEPASPYASDEPQRPRQQSSGTIAELSGTLDKLPDRHRLWAFLALVLAVLVAYLANRGVWGGEPPVAPSPAAPKVPGVDPGGVAR